MSDTHALAMEDDVELNLMDQAHGLDGEAHFLAPIDGEPAEAIMALQSMPHGTQEQVRKLLRSSERLRYVEKPSRWRCTCLLPPFSLHSL